MERIPVERATYERLQRHAKPFVDTPDIVINRALDALERSDGPIDSDHSGETVKDERQIDPKQLPRLTHTKVLDASIAGTPINRPNWNSLIGEMLRHAKKNAGSFEAVRRICPVNMVAGKKEDEGYDYLPDIDLSVQGQDSNAACRAMIASAQAMGIDLEIGFMWRLKDNAAFPGERARLRIRGASGTKPASRSAA